MGDKVIKKKLAVFGTCAALAFSGCSSGPGRVADHRWPYPQSAAIKRIVWDFSSLQIMRQAHGSDLWPCTSASDDSLYCAWGDGGGFDGNDDNVGRVSLGFAHLSGFPRLGDPTSLSGKNVWGAPPYAEYAATFGGKVGSMMSAGDLIFAVGNFWTPDIDPDPVHHSGAGPKHSLAWSSDGAKSWTIAPWTVAQPLGAFLDAGAVTDLLAYTYLYFLRVGDDEHLYLKRAPVGMLRHDPADGTVFDYFSGGGGNHPRWSPREADALAVFRDHNHAQGPCAVYWPALKRYLLTVGHYASGSDNDSSAGQVGLFESKHPWGPWKTVAYYDNWGGLQHETYGDFLGLRLPSKWLSADGTTLWAVFSGLNAFDSFNIVPASLELAAHY